MKKTSKKSTPKKTTASKKKAATSNKTNKAKSKQAAKKGISKAIATQVAPRVKTAAQVASYTVKNGRSMSKSQKKALLNCNLAAAKVSYSAKRLSGIKSKALAMQRNSSCQKQMLTNQYNGYVKNNSTNGISQKKFLKQKQTLSTVLVGSIPLAVMLGYTGNLALGTGGVSVETALATSIASKISTIGEQLVNKVLNSLIKSVGKAILVKDIIKDKDNPIPLLKYIAYSYNSIKNKDSKYMTLGKYDDGGPTSYVTRAKSTGDMYFDMGSDWDMIEHKYNLNEKDMFNIFNKPAIDYAVERGKIIRFTHNPELEQGDSALAWEWGYLQEKYGYKRLIIKEGYWYAT